MMQKPRKVKVTLRLDREVIEFFKNVELGYESKINEILLTLVRTHKANTSR